MASRLYVDQLAGSGGSTITLVSGQTLDTSNGTLTISTVEPTGDTSAGDSAAIGYTAADGIIVTGQGSTSDITIRNDADADVLTVATGTTNVDIVGDVTASTVNADGDTSAGDNAAIGYTAAEGLILTGQGSTNDITIKNDADGDVISIPTGTTNVTIAGDLTISGDDLTMGTNTSGAALIADGTNFNPVVISGDISINTSGVAAIGSGVIVEADIADNAVTLAKMAGGTDGNIISFDASGDPVAVATGTDGQVLTSSGAGAVCAFEDASGGGMTSVQVFTSSGTWTKPSGINSVRVQLVGSGAAGNHSGKGGGAGGYSEKWIDVSSISTVSVTVGGARSGNQAGETTSFGAHCSATGGVLASGNNGGYGGAGTGGDINIYGGGGDYHDTGASGAGGSSYFGGGQAGRGSTMDSSYDAYMAYGSGGTGVYNGYTQRGTGTGGVVVVYEYA